METIILIILGLIAGYLFITKFDKIDRTLFASDDSSEYHSSGTLVIYICAAIGAILGVVMLMDSDYINELKVLIAFCLSIMICASIFQAFLCMNTAAAILGKSLFMTFSCILAMVIGIVGSVAVIILIIIYLILAIMGKAAFGDGGLLGSSSSKPNSYVIDGDGNHIPLKYEGDDIYRDNQGNQWIDKGNGKIQKLD